MEEDLSRTLEQKFSQRIHNIERGQYKWFFGWSGVGLSVILLAVAFNKLGVFFSAPFFLFAFVGAWRYALGPGYHILGLRAESRQIRRRGNKLTQSTDETQQKRRKKISVSPINAHLMSYSVKTMGHNNLAVLYNPPRDSDASIIRVKGWDGVMLDPIERYAAENRWSEAVMDGVNRNKNSVGITQTVMIRPHNVLPSRRFREARMHPSIIVAGNRTFDGDDVPRNKHERLAKEAMDLDQSRMLYDRDVTSFVSVNVPRPSNWPKTLDGSLSRLTPEGKLEGVLTQSETDHAPVVAMTERIQRNLAAIGVQQVEALDMDGMRTLARTSWDLNMEDWFAKLDSDDPKYDEMTNEHFWPWPELEILVGRDKDDLPYVDFGGSFHRVWRVFRRDGRKVFPGEFSSLYASGDIGNAFETGLTVTMTGDTFPIQRELLSMNRFITLQRGLNTKTTNPDRYVSQQERDEYFAMEKRQTMLYQSGTDGLYWNTLIATSATTLEGLSGVDKAVDTHATRLGLQLRIVPFEAAQVPAFYSATLATCMM